MNKLLKNISANHINEELFMTINKIAKIPRCRILDGKTLSNAIREDLKYKLSTIMQRHSIINKPKLKIIFIGDKQDSKLYIDNKIKECKYMGVESDLVKFDESISINRVIEEIDKSNSDKNIHGIIVQLPVPRHLESSKIEILSKIDIKKDVDGFNFLSQGGCGGLFKADASKSLISPTAVGVREIIRLADVYNNNLEAYIKDYLLGKSLTDERIDLNKKQISILGKGFTAGLPISILMQSSNAKLVQINSKSERNFVLEKLKESDIIISAVGKKNLIIGEHIKDNCIIIDVGISVDVNPENGSRRITGDVNFESCWDKCKYITPVPGGVGKMTVIMLVKNVIQAWMTAHKIDLNEFPNLVN